MLFFYYIMIFLKNNLILKSYLKRKQYIKTSFLIFISERIHRNIHKRELFKTWN